jgi:phospholipid-binding lipoprotein MlaA
VSSAATGRSWLAGARNLALAALLVLCSGCATNGDPRDPAEPFNRAMYGFNEAFDEAILKPVATGYREVVPGPVRGFVRNFFANIADLLIGVNNLLQGKPLDALTDWTRFTFNTLFGVFGIVDFASEMGLEKHDEDFGQTFGRWGMPDGPYLVIPFLGSSSVRDGTALILDWGLDPVAVHDPKGVRWFMIGTRAISKRADLLDASRILEEAALDKYVFQRDAYLQRRRNLVHDGNPPRAQREAPPRAEEPEQAPRVEAVEQPRPGPQGGLQVLEHPAGG